MSNVKVNQCDVERGEKEPEREKGKGKGTGKREEKEREKAVPVSARAEGGDQVPSGSCQGIR
jgi:hypothetical protein